MISEDGFVCENTCECCATGDRVVNVPFLRQELEFITANRERWDQTVWVYSPELVSRELSDDFSCDDFVYEESDCGTTACLAGWTVLHAKGLIFNKQTGNVFNEAAEILGLSREQASLLFYSGLTLYGLWKYANEITEGEIEIPIEIEQEPHEIYKY